MKKDILFVIDSLDCAGAEKSLVSLLSLLDYSKYNIDLMLFAHGGVLEELVPREVNVLPPLEYTQFTSLSLKDAVLYSLRNFNFQMLFSRLKYSYAIRTEKSGNTKKARFFWENISNSIEKNPKQYDIAISYAQGIPTFYVVEKVHAKKKFAWVNTSLSLKDREKVYQEKFYAAYHKIITVSDKAKEVFLETFPDFAAKTDVIYDINNFELILNLSQIGESYQDEFDGVRILTIGRLSKEKGYDIALEACKRLKENGVLFRWYVLGKGPLLEDIQQKIKQYDIESHFVLLGVKSNPYSYIKDADIYVQTSKFEGFGLAIAEARMLNVPVVTTNFDSAYIQMVDGENGLVVEMNGEAVCEGIMRMIDNPKLKEEIISYLKTEKKGNIEEIGKFYQLIG